MPQFIYDRIVVGNHIREYREKLDLTQEVLAERIGRSWRLIADLERGVVGLSMETLFRLCNVLKTTPNDLLLPEKSGDMGELEWLNEVLANSPEHVRATAIDIVRTYLRSV